MNGAELHNKLTSILRIVADLSEKTIPMPTVDQSFAVLEAAIVSLTELVLSQTTTINAHAIQSSNTFNSLIKHEKVDVVDGKLKLPNDFIHIINGSSFVKDRHNNPDKNSVDKLIIVDDLSSVMNPRFVTVTQDGQELLFNEPIGKKLSHIHLTYLSKHPKLNSGAGLKLFDGENEVVAEAARLYLNL